MAFGEMTIERDKTIEVQYAFDDLWVKWVAKEIPSKNVMGRSITSVP